jgi:hypothetical protein
VVAVHKANAVARGAGAAKKMADSARYYTYRAGLDRDVRQWYDQDGRELSYAAVQQGIRTHAQAYTYSFRVVVSPGLEGVSREVYRSYVAGLFEHCYWIEHGNTAHEHAHVIGFRNTRIPKQLLNEKRQELTLQVAHEVALRQERQRQLAQHMEQHLERQRRREQHLERERGHGLGL